VIRFAANLTTLYPQLDVLERFAAARADGFVGVEYLAPYQHPPATLRGLLDDLGLELVLFNAPAGSWDAGERGIAALPGRQAEFRESWHAALEYATELRCPRVHVLAGVGGSDRRGPMLDTFLGNVDWAAALAEPLAVDVLIEPLNQRDMPGYLISSQADAHRVVTTLGRPNVGVQLDLYHLQISEGDVTMTLRRDLPTGRVRHIQIAGVPHRHEPDRGELEAFRVLRTIDSLGYAGWIGCEYTPHHDTSSGLTWIAEWESRSL
jgi:hydroxypyruvate isomerase